MSTHTAVVAVGIGKPLQLLQVQTPVPTDTQVRVKIEWTASTPLDLHQADGGLLVHHPQVLGDGIAGTVDELGADVSKLKIGDAVFGFVWRNSGEKAHQEYVVTNENLLGKLPEGLSLQQAVTVPNNFVTTWHTFTKYFELDLPWPKPAGFEPRDKEAFFLVWGGSSSVGQYALQLLKYYGYKNVIATASKTHHTKLGRYGARRTFDYRDTDVEAEILEYAGDNGVAYIVDCIGSFDASVTPISRIAKSGTVVAIMLPVILRDASPGVTPQYEMDVEKGVSWATGVRLHGVRTHFYLENKFLADKLQSEIMPLLLEQGVIEPNDQVVVEGKTLLERAENALSKLRNKEVSGARLVWRIADA